MEFRARTKDERFMILLYEEAEKSGDIFNPMDRYLIGNLLGLHNHAVDTICNQLARANFIKKVGDSEIRLTENGKVLVLELLKE
jgi:Mn-dependent DtxR family transcriptional regulator